MPAKRPARGSYRLRDLINTGRLLGVKCGLCSRCAYFDPADLLAIFGDQDVETPPFPCSRCKTIEFIGVFFHDIRPGDYGRLPIRRPRKVEKVVWRTVKLGDPAT